MKKTGTIYIVATPLGNLDDITHRALSVLKDVDRIICEDTRVTKKLLFHFSISKPLLVLNAHTSDKKRLAIIKHITEGENLALVTDAGTPGISDPGGKLIEEIIEKCDAQTNVVAVPGPSALIAALSIAGVPADRFYFAGYPPHKKGRTKYFTTAASYRETVVLYESKHRIEKTLLQIVDHFEPDRSIVIARELTKMHETIIRTTIGELRETLESIDVRGEFVIVIGKP